EERCVMSKSKRSRKGGVVGKRLLYNLSNLDGGLVFAEPERARFVFRLQGQVAVLGGLGEAEYLVGYPVPLGVPLPSVLVELQVDRAAADHVEGVDDVVEAQPNGRLGQSLLGQFSAVELPTGVEELAGGSGCLLVCVPEVGGNVPGKWQGQFG